MVHRGFRVHQKGIKKICSRTGDASDLSVALQNDSIYYHEGTIGGSWPRILSDDSVNGTG
jgi:hypothetical protein